jgi:hypothetical protein
MSNIKITSRSCFEDLPNELFHEIQLYSTYSDLLNGFSNLNERYQFLLESLSNLHIEIRSTVDEQRSQTNSFVSRIRHLIIPDDSDAVSIAPIYSNVYSLSIHWPIRLLPKSLRNVQRIKLDLSTILPKQAIGLCKIIFSTEFPSLSCLYILHRKSRVHGHWKLLINSIQTPCPTLTEFIFDIKPTLEWNMFEKFLSQMPNLKRLTIRIFNTRSKWTFSFLAHTLQTNVPNLTSLFIRINSFGMRNIQSDNENLPHPLFRQIQSKSRKTCSMTMISSKEKTKS